MNEGECCLPTRPHYAFHVHFAFAYRCGRGISGTIVEWRPMLISCTCGSPYHYLSADRYSALSLGSGFINCHMMIRWFDVKVWKNTEKKKGDPKAVWVVSNAATPCRGPPTHGTVRHISAAVPCRRHPAPSTVRQISAAALCTLCKID